MTRDERGPAFRHRRVLRFVKEFFTRAGTVVDLAIFRIVLFAALVWLFSKHDSVYFTGLAKERLSHPTRTAWIVRFMPLNPDAALIIDDVFVIA